MKNSNVDLQSFQSFSDAYNLVAVQEKPGDVITPFVFKNDTGRELFLRFDETFRVSSCLATVFSTNMNSLFSFRRLPPHATAS